MENENSIPNEIEVDVDINTSNESNTNNAARSEKGLTEDIEENVEPKFDKSLSEKISQVIENTEFEEDEPEEYFGDGTTVKENDEDGENIEEEEMPHRTQFQLITFYDENGNPKKKMSFLRRKYKSRTHNILNAY